MQPEFEQIIESDLPDVEKLAQTFLFILRQQQAYSENEIELQRAIGDTELMVKEQIKKGVLKYSAEIFAYYYFRTTGRTLNLG